MPPRCEVILNDQTWADYKALLAHRREDAAIKIRSNSYSPQIQIMSPMASHGRRIDYNMSRLFTL